MRLHSQCRDDIIDGTESNRCCSCTDQLAIRQDTSRFVHREQVKGKQVKILYDLVTVSKEDKAMRRLRGH